MTSLGKDGHAAGSFTRDLKTFSLFYLMLKQDCSDISMFVGACVCAHFYLLSQRNLIFLSGSGPHYVNEITSSKERHSEPLRTGRQKMRVSPGRMIDSY